MRTLLSPYVIGIKHIFVSFPNLNNKQHYHDNASIVNLLWHVTFSLFHVIECVMT